MTKWKTKDGRILEISEMESAHILNCIEMLRKKGRVTPSEHLVMLSDDTPVDNVVESYKLKHLIDEMNKRNIEEMNVIKCPHCQQYNLIGKGENLSKIETFVCLHCQKPIKNKINNE